MDINPYTPFKFNRLKHHLSEVISFVEEQRELNWSDQFFSRIKILGENIIDIYIGGLSIADIIQQIKSKLLSENYFEYDSYQSMFISRSFRKITLSDNSVWVLTKGFNKEEYIHIYPGKHSPQTFRTHSNALKTAVCFYYFYGMAEMALEPINRMRKDNLGLSPVKTLEELNKLKVIHHFIKKKILVSL